MSVVESEASPVASVFVKLTWESCAQTLKICTGTATRGKRDQVTRGDARMLLAFPCNVEVFGRLVEFQNAACDLGGSFE